MGEIIVICSECGTSVLASQAKGWWHVITDKEAKFYTVFPIYTHDRLSAQTANANQRYVCSEHCLMEVERKVRA